MASFIVRFNSESLPYNVAPACEQWETGQSMEIAGFSAPITVSFACGGTAKTVSGTPKNIPIPDALLEIGKDIFATFDVNGITYTIKIPVIRQEKPPVETPAAPTLPIVSDADDGKLLGVQNGKWNVVEGGSGSGGVYTVNVTQDENTEEYASDKTREEIVAAYEQGNRIVAFVDGYGYWPLTSMEITYDDDDNEYLVPYFRQNVFDYSGLDTGEIGMVCTTIAIDTDNVYFSQAEGYFDITPIS